MKKDKFNQFKKECQFWIDKLELNNWTFRYNKMKREQRKKFEQASIETFLSNCQADVYFEKKDFKTEEEIKQAAKHEIIHCLIGKLYLLGISRFGLRDEIDREEEELCHKLEKLL